MAAEMNVPVCVCVNVLSGINSQMQNSFLYLRVNFLIFVANVRNVGNFIYRIAPHTRAQPNEWKRKKERKNPTLPEE